MPLAHACRHGVNRFTVRDVADFVFAAELLGERTQPLLTAREQHAQPPASRQLSSERVPDPARCAGDYSYLHTRTIRRAVAVRPLASRTLARNVCLPFVTFLTFQSLKAMPAASGLDEPIFRLPL